MANVRHLHYICGMIELSRHIETLLLENDCVILPGFGGFITHYAPAAWDSQEYTFRPPTRIVGFNPQLKINDGLLAQSYMAAHDTSFGKAMQMLEKEIEELRQTLHEDGAADLRNVGRLRCSMHQVYDFTPYADGMTAPELYGLGSFKMLPLAELEVLERQEAAAARALRPAKPVRRTAIRRRMAYIANVAATIVAVVLFFALSTPIENTEVMKGNYAQMFPETFFEQIESQSLAITPINARNAETRPANVQAEACRPVDTQAASCNMRDAACILLTAQRGSIPKNTGISTAAQGTHRLGPCGTTRFDWSVSRLCAKGETRRRLARSSTA